MSQPDDALSAWQRFLAPLKAWFNPPKSQPLPDGQRVQLGAHLYEVKLAMAGNPFQPSALPVIPKTWLIASGSNFVVQLPSPQFTVSFDNLPPAPTRLLNGGQPMPDGPCVLSWNPNQNQWEGRPVGTAGAWETATLTGNVLAYHGFGSASMLLFVG